jgi:uncharacterized protein YbdZ (MbtH family)
MSWNDPDKEDTTIYKVVVNHEEQYSIWPEHKENPLGWRDIGKVGPKPDCLAYIKEVWTDMRPLSLRKKMEEMANSPIPPPPPEPDEPPHRSLVDRLCDGDHLLEPELRPERTAQILNDAIAANYVHLKFTETKGGTVLGMRLDREACDFSKADFESGTGTLHLEGGLMLDYVKVRCVADLDLEHLSGKGHLIRADAGVVH